MKALSNDLHRFRDHALDNLSRQLDSAENQIKREIKKYLASKSGKARLNPLLGSISLFHPMNLEQRETAQIGALAWMLSENGNHGFENLLANAVTSKILNASKVQVSEVRAEDFVNNGRDRLDVVIEGTYGGIKRAPFICIIEAKIRAPLGPKQLERYLRYLSGWEKRNKNGLAKLAVLAPEDWDDTLPEGVIKLSYVDLAGILISKMESVANTPGVHYLQMYITGLLKDIEKLQLPIHVGDSPLISQYKLIQRIKGQ